MPEASKRNGVIIVPTEAGGSPRDSDSNGVLK